MIRTGSAILLLCIAVSAAAQPLTCPNSSPSGCTAFHYHLQAWSPELKSTGEFSGIAPFASAAACEEGRRIHQTANANALQFLATEARRMKTQANVYGECHCDMTRDPRHPNYLDDRMRDYQVRTEQEFRNHMLRAWTRCRQGVERCPGEESIARSSFAGRGIASPPGS